MDWLLLLLAGFCEIGWPLGLKLSEIDFTHKWLWVLVAIISIGASGIFLFFAQKTIPIGTAYAVWTGIGAAGTFIIGIVWFKDPVSMLRISSVLLIISGIIGLKLASH